MKKNYIHRGVVAVLLPLVLVACKKSFLERQPEDSLALNTFFNTSEDLRVYANGLYNATMPYYDFQSGSSVANGGLDVGSDVMMNSTPTASLLQRSATGIAPSVSATWNNTYDNIRTVNIMLQNYPKVASRNVNANQYIGEGYFFRAWHYYSLLRNFGGVPFIDKPLVTTDPELYKAKSPRNELASFIIKDLDSAIANLSLKGVGPAGAGRINKEAALTMKARVALFEGSWEYYHGKNSTPFAVSGKDGKDFLQLVEPTVRQLITTQGTNIYRAGGVFNEPYNQLFAITNGESAAGVFWYRVYDTKLLTANSHDFYSKITVGPWFTDRLINMYLDKNGLPQSMSALSFQNLNDKGQNLEPRFRQTVWTPDRGVENKLPGRTAGSDVPLRYPTVNNGGFGYRQWKGAILNRPNEYRAGETDDILIRYEEALLAMAEAKAILGTITQADLDVTVNVIRGRVNTPAMNLATVNGWSVTYAKAQGFDPTESRIVNEVRRERTIEFANEGFRLNDLKRWAVYVDALTGYKPRGARLQEFLDYFNTASNLTADGCNNCLTDPTLRPNDNVQADANGLINPYFKSVDFNASGNGYFINQRDYLQAIPTGQIDLYKLNNVVIPQNPGWN